MTEKLGTIDVSISFGFSTKDQEDLIIQDVFKKAEDSMYYNKLFESPLMKEKTVDIIIKTLYHHERWDGKGYPRVLKGKEIALSQE